MTTKRLISLTAIPPRFGDLPKTLKSLVAQKVDSVLLYIPHSYTRFPDWDGMLPVVPEGVTICRTDRDLGPATKILPACCDLRGQDVQILFCDDDCRVPPGWARRLFDIQARRPWEAVAVYVRPAYLPRSGARKERQAWQMPVRYDLPFRVSRVVQKLFGTETLYRRPFWIPGYGEVLFGAGGAVVRPDFFDDTAFNIPDVAWPVDDIWLSAMLARKGVRIYCPWMAALPKSQDSTTTAALADQTFQGMKRQELNRATSEYCRDIFGIWT